MARTASVTRNTSETRITATLDLDGTGQARVATGVGFLDHMLTALARHAMLDLDVQAEGDLHIDFHHTTEDVGIVLGQALTQALGDKRGIRRYGHASLPMDEALVDAALDLSGRPFIAWDVRFGRDKVGEMDTELFEEFFRAFAMNGLMTLHVTQRAGRNAHHVAEACFKAVARALRQASRAGPACRRGDPVHQGVAVRIYTAHLRPARPPVLVREGWSWGAALFGPFWLLAHRAWVPGVIVLSVVVLGLLLLSPALQPVMALGLGLQLGLLGRDLVRWSLDRRGYALAHVLAAADQEAALGRLLDARADLAAVMARPR